MPMTPKEMNKLLEENGYEEVRGAGKGSHKKFYKQDTKKTIIVPQHGKKELKKGLEHSILKQAGIEKKED